MIPKRPVKPLELVVSAIQCLTEKKGWSVQKIIKFLNGKYALDIDRLKPLVCEGIKKGLASGVLTHRSGLFRLKDSIGGSLKKSLHVNREKMRRLATKMRRRLLKKSKNYCYNNCQKAEKFEQSKGERKVQEKYNKADKKAAGGIETGKENVNKSGKQK